MDEGHDGVRGSWHRRSAAIFDGLMTPHDRGLKMSAQVDRSMSTSNCLTLDDAPSSLSIESLSCQISGDGVARSTTSSSCPTRGFSTVFLSGQSLNKQMTQRAKCSACLLAPERIWELYRAPQKIGHDRTHEWITMPRTWLIARVSWRRGSHEASRRSLRTGNVLL